MNANISRMIKDLTDDELAYELEQSRPGTLFHWALWVEFQERYERRGAVLSEAA